MFPTRSAQPQKYAEQQNFLSLLLVLRQHIPPLTRSSFHEGRVLPTANGDVRQCWFSCSHVSTSDKTPRSSLAAIIVGPVVEDPRNRGDRTSFDCHNKRNDEMGKSSEQQARGGTTKKEEGSRVTRQLVTNQEAVTSQRALAVLGYQQPAAPAPNDERRKQLAVDHGGMISTAAPSHTTAQRYGSSLPTLLLRFAHVSRQAGWTRMTLFRPAPVGAHTACPRTCPNR